MTFRVAANNRGQVFMDACGRKLRNSLTAANAKAAAIIIEGIQQSALRTFKHNSPDGLNASFQVSKVSKDGAEIRSSLVYAGIHEVGGTIRAKNKPYLVFQLDDGTFRKMKQVKLPARHYMSRGVELKRSQLEAFARDHLATVVRNAKAEAGG